MKISEDEARRMVSLETEIEVPEGENPLEYLAEQFGEPTPHEEMPEFDISEQSYTLSFK